MCNFYDYIFSASGDEEKAAELRLQDSGASSGHNWHHSTSTQLPPPSVKLQLPDNDLNWDRTPGAVGKGGQQQQQQQQQQQLVANYISCLSSGSSAFSVDSWGDLESLDFFQTSQQAEKTTEYQQHHSNENSYTNHQHHYHHHHPVLQDHSQYRLDEQQQQHQQQLQQQQQLHQQQQLLHQQQQQLHQQQPHQLTRLHSVIQRGPRSSLSKVRNSGEFIISRIQMCFNPHPFEF